MSARDESAYRAGAVEAAAERIRLMAPALRDAEQRFNRLAAVAAREPDPFLFVCEERLRDLAARLSYQARVMPELPAMPAEAARHGYWLRIMQSGAARTVPWVTAMEEISLAAGLLALESSLRLRDGGTGTRQLASDLDGLADELSRAWAGLRTAAADLAWAAQEAAQWAGQSKQGSESAGTRRNDRA